MNLDDRVEDLSTQIIAISNSINEQVQEISRIKAHLDAAINDVESKKNSMHKFSTRLDEVRFLRDLRDGYFMVIDKRTGKEASITWV